MTANVDAPEDGDVWSTWSTLLRAFRSDDEGEATEEDTVSTSVLREMAGVFLDLFEAGIAFEELIVKTLMKWTGMAAVCKTVSKLYRSFVEWYGENDDDKQQLYDFGKYVVSFVEVATILLKFVPPQLGLKVIAGVGLVIGLLFLIMLARMAYEHYRQNQRRTQNSMPPKQAATLREQIHKVAAEVVTSCNDAVVAELQRSNVATSAPDEQMSDYVEGEAEVSTLAITVAELRSDDDSAPLMSTSLYLEDASGSVFSERRSWHRYCRRCGRFVTMRAQSSDGSILCDPCSAAS